LLNKFLEACDHLGLGHVAGVDHDRVIGGAQR
jgi:hypothetical protein